MFLEKKDHSLKDNILPRNFDIHPSSFQELVLVFLHLLANNPYFKEF